MPKDVCGVPEVDVLAIVREAVERTAAGDFGRDIVYQLRLHAEAFKIAPGSGLHFMRLLGDQVRIIGSRRLGDRVLLDFSEQAPSEPNAPLLFAPESHIRVTLFVPGPTHSELTKRFVTSTAEIVASICSMALGRVVEMPTALPSPVDAGGAESAERRRLDPSILTLARESISLDVFNDFAARGGEDGQLRVRGARLS
jgi:hypothetical protein